MSRLSALSALVLESKCSQVQMAQDCFPTFMFALAVVTGPVVRANVADLENGY